MHEYQRRFDLAVQKSDLATQLRGKVTMLNIMHDNDCPALARTGECDCNPDLIACDLDGKKLFSIDKDGNITATQ